jgi:hypothetical protein
MDEKPSRLDPLDALTLENLHLKMVAACDKARDAQTKFNTDLERIHVKYAIAVGDVLVVETGAIERKP